MALAAESKANARDPVPIHTKEGTLQCGRPKPKDVLVYMLWYRPSRTYQWPG